MTKDFDTAFATFMEGVERIANANDGKGWPVYSFEAEVGQRYIRVVRIDASDKDHGPRRSAHCFVDRTNGEVLKTGGWKAPAKTKQSRGNIFDAKNGLASMRRHGLVYLNYFAAEEEN